MLASDADRELCLNALREHFSAGRLDTEQFKERVEAVLTARELEALPRTLTGLPGVTTTPAGPPAVRRRREARFSVDGLSGLVFAGWMATLFVPDLGRWSGDAFGVWVASLFVAGATRKMFGTRLAPARPRRRIAGL